VKDAAIPPVATISTRPVTAPAPPPEDDSSPHTPPPIRQVQTTQTQDFPDNRSSASTVSECSMPDRSTSGGSVGGKSLLYGKVAISPIHHPSHQMLHPPQAPDTSTNRGGVGAGVLFGKSSSLIFPTGLADAAAGPSSTTPSSGATIPTSTSGVGGSQPVPAASVVVAAAAVVVPAMLQWAAEDPEVSRKT